MSRPEVPLRPVTTGTNLWTARQAAEYLGVDESTVRKWARIGELPHVRLGWSPHRKTIRFDPNSLALYVRSRYIDTR